MQTYAYLVDVVVGVLFLSSVAALTAVIVLA
jgi:hypothetical protein